MNTQDETVPTSELVLYRTDDAQTRIQVRLDGQSVWLTQRQMADLFQVTIPTINEHLAAIYAEREIEPERTLRKFRIVQNEGGRDVRRLVDHYHLDAILAVGYRVRSARGTQFRQWATAPLQPRAQPRAGLHRPHPHPPRPAPGRQRRGHRRCAGAARGPVVGAGGRLGGNAVG